MKKTITLTAVFLFITCLMLAQSLGDNSINRKELAKQAKKENYTINENSATKAYLDLITKSIAEGNTKKAQKASMSLMKDAKKAQAWDAREAALELWMNANPTEATKMAINTLKDKSSRYRSSALRAAAKHNINGELYKEIIKVLPKAKDDVKNDIANWIAEEAKYSDSPTKLQELTEPLIKGLTTENIALQRAISNALVQLENPKAIIPLVLLLRNTNTESVKVGKEALANFNGDITTPLAKSIRGSSDTSKIAIIELLALRKSTKHLGEIISLINTGSDEVKKVAYNALKDVVEAKDVNSMCSMLEIADAEYTESLQNAIIAALTLMPKEDRFEEISKLFNDANDNKKHLYYKPLAATKNYNALDLIIEGFKDNNTTKKDAAFDALASWNDVTVAEKLIDLCKGTPYENRILDK